MPKLSAVTLDTAPLNHKEDMFLCVDQTADELSKVFDIPRLVEEIISDLDFQQRGDFIRFKKDLINNLNHIIKGGKIVMKLSYNKNSIRERIIFENLIFFTTLEIINAIPKEMLINIENDYLVEYIKEICIKVFDIDKSFFEDITKTRKNNFSSVLTQIIDNHTNENQDELTKVNKKTPKK